MPQSPYQNYNQGGMQSGGRPVRQGPGNRYIPPTYNFGRGMYGADYNSMDWNNVQQYDLPQQGNNPYQQQYMQGLRNTTGRFPQGGRGPQMPQFRGQGGGGGYGGGRPQYYNADGSQRDPNASRAAVGIAGDDHDPYYDARGNRIDYAGRPYGNGGGGQGGRGGDFYTRMWDMESGGGRNSNNEYPGDNNFNFGDFFGDGPQMPNFRNGGYGGPNGGGGYGVGFGGGYGGGRGGGNMQQFMQMMQQYMQGQGGQGNGPNAGGGNGWQGGGGGKAPWQPGGGVDWSVGGANDVERPNGGNAPFAPGKDGNPLQIGGNNTNAPPNGGGKAPWEPGGGQSNAPFAPGKDGTPLQIGGNNSNAPPNGGNGGGSNWWEDPSYNSYFQNWMRMMNGFNGGGNAPPPPNGGNGGGGGR